MATTLLEKRLLDYKDKKVKNLSLDKILVSYYLNSGKGTELKTKKLNELFIKVSKGDKVSVRPVSSYDEFVKEFAKGNVFVENSVREPLPKDGSFLYGDRSKTNRTNPYYESFKINEFYESTEELPKTTLKNNNSVVENSIVPYGLSRTMKVQENETSRNDNYLMITFNNGNKQEFVKKSEIYILEGGKRIPIYDSVTGYIDFSKLKGATLWVNNKIIDNLYTEKEFTFGEYQKFEKINYEDLKREKYEIIKNPTAEQIEKVKTGEVIEFDGAYYAKTDSTQEDKFYAEQTLKIVSVSAPTRKDPDKTKEEAYYATKIYEVSANGNLIKLNLKGANKVQMVELDKICDINGNKIEKNNIKNYVGKPIYVKDENNNLVESETLTYEQAIYFYNKQYNYEPSISSDDILAPNAYLQTKNGEFVQEANIRPISYKFTKSKDCDAYLIRVETANGVKNQIVSAEDYKTISSKYQIKAAYALTTCDYASADVVQTTTNKKQNSKILLEDCSILKSYNAEKNIFEELQENDLKNLKETVLKQILEVYSNGQYNVDHVFVDGEKIELDERMKRYILTDEHLMRDYASDTLRYVGLKKSEVTYESTDGKLGKFKGNAKFGFGKVCAKAYSIWAKSLVYYIGFTMTGAGLLAALAAPAVMVVAAGAIIAAPVLIPPIAGIACWLSNLTRRPFKDKTKYNRKKWNKNFEKELVALNEDMKETNFSKGYSKDAFLAKIGRIKAGILASSKATIGNGFEVVDGTIKVDGENVNDVMKFRKEHKKELKILKQREKEIEKAQKIYDKLAKPFKKDEEKGKILNTESEEYKEFKQAEKVLNDLKDLYKVEKDDFDKKMASFTGKAKTMEKDPKQADAVKRVDRLKNFWLVKKFSNNGFTEEEIKELDNLEYDPAKDLFITKGGQYIADTLKPKVWLSSQESVIIPEADKNIVNLLTKVNSMMDNQDKPVETEGAQQEEKVDEKDNKPEQEKQVKKKRLNNKIITYENNIIKELEDVESSTYEYISKLLTKKSGKFAMSKEDAADAIFNFTAKANEAHANQMHAQDVLKNNPVDYYILQKAIIKISKAATLQR